MVAQPVKRLPTVWETRVQSLGREDLLEKGMATYSSILVPPPPEKKGRSKKYFGEGNGNTLQCSCQENSMDGGAWWATVHVVAELDTTEQLHFTIML